MPDVNDEATGLLAAHKATDLEDEVEAGTTDSTPKIAAGEELKSDDTPTIDPYEKKNIAIVLSYFCVGFGMTFIGTPLTYYMVDELNASAEEQNVISVIMSLPWSFKLLYGFLSDGISIFGMRRKPYFVAGWLIYIMANFILAFQTRPSIQMLAIMMLIQTMGYVCSDVMTDTMIVEQSKELEGLKDRGSFQAVGYTVRTAGTCLGSVLGAFLYNKESWGLSISQVFVINAVLPSLLLAPSIPMLLELPREKAPPSIREQCTDIFALVKRRAVWQPCCFVFIYNAFQVSNAAWSNFLILGLGFGAWQIGVLTIIASFASWAGIVVYKKYFFESSWRNIYISTTFLSAFFSLLQLQLISGKTLGLSAIWFALGDTAVWSFILYIQFLPMCIMYSGMCPDGSEGASYAMLTTLSNMGGTVATDISSLLVGIWNVSDEAIEKHKYSGMTKLTILTSLLQLAPLPLLFLIPKDKKEQLELQKSDETSFAAGSVFIGVLVVALTCTVVENVLYLI